MFHVKGKNRERGCSTLKERKLEAGATTLKKPAHNRQRKKQSRDSRAGFAEEAGDLAEHRKKQSRDSRKSSSPAFTPLSSTFTKQSRDSRKVIRERKIPVCDQRKQSRDSRKWLRVRASSGGCSRSKQSRDSRKSDILPSELALLSLQ